MPKFSIITVCLNNKQGLEKTIRSAVNQSFKDYEYIIVDGASIDGSVEVIREYEPYITKWVSEKDTGIYNAMNKAIKMATGDFLFFLNSGDTFFNDDVLAKMPLGNTIDIAYGDVLLHGPYESYITKIPENLNLVNNDEFLVYENGLFRTPDVLTKENLFRNTLPHQSTFIKRKLFTERKRLYDERYEIASDYDFVLWAFLRKKASFKRVDLVISVFDFYGVSTTNQDQLKCENDKIKRMYFGFFPWLFRQKKVIDLLFLIRIRIKYPKYTLSLFIKKITLLLPPGLLRKLMNKLFKAL